MPGDPDEPTHVGRYSMRARNNQSLRYTGLNAKAVIAFVNRYKTAEAHVSNLLFNMEPVAVVVVVSKNTAMKSTLFAGDHLILSDTGEFYSMPDAMWNLTYNKG